MFEHLLNNL